MGEIRILSITPFEAKPRDNGDQVVGRFDCEFRGIRIVSCTLLKRSNGDLSVMLPVFRNGDRSGSKIPFKDRIYIKDAGLMNALRKAATQAYEEALIARANEPRSEIHHDRYASL